METGQTQKAFGWAARDPSGHLSPIHFKRRGTGDEDVTIKVLYCGVCHSDLHYVKNEWGNAHYPAIPGHEIVGEVTQVGTKVNKIITVGDRVGVGGIINSCRTCANCTTHLENYCPNLTLAFGSPTTSPDNNNEDEELPPATCGGYSDIIVVNHHFTIRIPDTVRPDSLPSLAPLLCAGITVYSPLRHFGLDKPGVTVGVVGLGGLGHMAVKFAKGFGAHVTVISTSPGKENEAVNRLGADTFLLSRDGERMAGAVGTMDGIIDTVSAVHDITPLLRLLKTRGKLVMLGVPEKPLELSMIPLLMGGKMVAGSGGGGIKETQEMMDFAVENGIRADVEVIPFNYINTAMERMVKSDVRYRFVIDVANTVLKP